MEMTNLITVNSSLTVVVTLQNWPQDTMGPFVDALIQKGFDVNIPAVQSGMPFAKKGNTSGLALDYLSRRISIQITNNITNPEHNISELFSVLKGIGYMPEESIERIDVNGYVTIKIQGEYRASSLVPNLVNNDVVEKIGKIMEHPTRAIGLRLSSEEPFIRGANASPFLLLLEPLYTDPSDSKLSVQLIYATDNNEKATTFLKDLYDRLKKIIVELDSDQNVSRTN
jgi:hypothetical protein